MSKTSEKIIDAAIQVYSKDPLAPIEQVANIAGVSRMTVHRHFSNRELLMEKIHETLIHRQLQIMEHAMSSTSSAWSQIEEIILLNAKERGFHLLFKEQKQHEDHNPLTCPFSEVNKKLLELIHNLRGQGFLREGVPDAWVFYLYDGVLFTASETMNNGSVAPVDIPKLAWTSFKNAVMTVADSHE